MAGSNVDLQPAYVIHTRPYRETSLLVEALTSEYGRIGLVARGASRPRSQLRSLLQPFVPLFVSWSGKGELLTLRHAEPAAGQVLPSSLPTGQRALSGFYINELVQRLCARGDAHPELFQGYVQAMQDLVECGEDAAALQIALRLFEKRLLDALGLGLVLGFEQETGQEVDAAAFYDYLPDQGPVRTHQGFGLNLSGGSLLALEREALEATHLTDLKRLMRKVLSGHLGDRPLKSRELFVSRKG